MQRKQPSSITITTNRTLKKVESGLLVIVDAQNLVASLPPWEEGLYYDFHIKTVSTGTGFSVSPVAADKINAGVVDKDWINSGATDVAGDSVRIVAGSVAGEWWAQGQRGTWAAQG